jgi:hypothetical protein
MLVNVVIFMDTPFLCTPPSSSKFFPTLQCLRAPTLLETTPLLSWRLGSNSVLTDFDCLTATVESDEVLFLDGFAFAILSHLFHNSKLHPFIIFLIGLR